MQEGSASPAAVSTAMEQMAEEMEAQPKYFDPELPHTFRFLAEATKDPMGATKAMVYGSVKSAENVMAFLGQRALGIGQKAVEAVEQHISKAVAKTLVLSLGAAALQISGAIPTAWGWLRPLLETLVKGSGG
jgi:hypothetical protein